MVAGIQSALDQAKNDPAVYIRAIKCLQQKTRIPGAD
jgi:hypothetical protein